MSSSRQRGEQAAKLLEEDAVANAQRVTDTIKQLAGSADALGRVPEPFLAGALHREWDLGESLRPAWEREDEPYLMEGAIKAISNDLSGLVDALHADETPEDTSGHADENLRDAVRSLKKGAGLADNFPSKLVESWLAYQLHGDSQAAEVFREKADNPARYEDMMRRAGHALREDANALITATKPSMKLPDDMTTADLADLPEKDFQRVVARYRRAQEAAKRGRKS